MLAQTIVEFRVFATMYGASFDTIMLFAKQSRQIISTVNLPFAGTRHNRSVSELICGGKGGGGREREGVSD